MDGEIFEIGFTVEAWLRIHEFSGEAQGGRCAILNINGGGKDGFLNSYSTRVSTTTDFYRISTDAEKPGLHITEFSLGLLDFFSIICRHIFVVVPLFI